MTEVRIILESAGVTMVNIPTQRLLDLDARYGFPITFYESGQEIPHYVGGLSQQYRKLSLADIAAVSRSQDVKDILLHIIENPVPREVYAEALRGRSQLQYAYAGIFSKNGIAALLYPTVPILPPKLNGAQTVRLNGRDAPVFDTSIRNTAPGSVAGTPAISLPAGRSSAGLPIGLSVEGAQGTDRDLLGIAAAVSKALHGRDV